MKIGLESLIGERVLLICSSYFYVGKLLAVASNCVELEDPALVYETLGRSGDGFAESDQQKLYASSWFVRLEKIESFGLAGKGRVELRRENAHYTLRETLRARKPSEE